MQTRSLGKTNTHSLLVGMKAVVVTLEISRRNTQKHKNVYYLTTQLICLVYDQRSPYSVLQSFAEQCSCHPSHNGQKMEMT